MVSDMRDGNSVIIEILVAVDKEMEKQKNCGSSKRIRVLKLPNKCGQGKNFFCYPLPRGIKMTLDIGWLFTMSGDGVAKD